jgi:hypothetical protein
MYNRPYQVAVTSTAAAARRLQPRYWRRGTGSRRELMTRMMALGMTAAEIRWHLARPGSSMPIVN